MVMVMVMVLRSQSSQRPPAVAPGPISELVLLRLRWWEGNLIFPQPEEGEHLSKHKRRWSFFSILTSAKQHNLISRKGTIEELRLDSRWVWFDLERTRQESNASWSRSAPGERGGYISWRASEGRKRGQNGVDNRKKPRKEPDSHGQKDDPRTFKNSNLQCKEGEERNLAPQQGGCQLKDASFQLATPAVITSVDMMATGARHQRGLNWWANNNPHPMSNSNHSGHFQIN